MFERYPERRQIIVNLKTERAFRGILWRRGGRYLVLRNAELVRPGGETVQMDGEVVVERANVDFIQVVR
jgi:small nuclear ribonucleoprotein (snRNP)-like protein